MEGEEEGDKRKNFNWTMVSTELFCYFSDLKIFPNIFLMEILKHEEHFSFFLISKG